LPGAGGNSNSKKLWGSISPINLAQPRDKVIFKQALSKFSQLHLANRIRFTIVLRTTRGESVIRQDWRKFHGPFIVWRNRWNWSRLCLFQATEIHGAIPLQKGPQDKIRRIFFCNIAPVDIFPDCKKEFIQGCGKLGVRDFRRQNPCKSVIHFIYLIPAMYPHR